MMRGARLSIMASGLRADAFVQAAKAAEAWGVAALWAHHDGGPASGGDAETATLIYLSAASAVTGHIRLGAFVDPPDRLARLRAAEDLGVIDQASGGRVEIVLGRLGAPRDSELLEQGWRQLLGGWRSWPGASGAGLAITPAPAQPWLPRLFIDDEHLAQRLGGGVLLTEPSPPRVESFLHRRVLLERASRLALPKPAGEVLTELAALRTRLHHSDADEAMIEVEPSSLEAGIRWLGTVVQPGIRFDDTEFEDMTLRAIDWFDKGGSRW